MSLTRRIHVARGDMPAERVLKHGRIVNLFSHEILEGDIAIDSGKIVGIGSYEGIETWDLDGRYVAPGFIDGHLHVESSMVTIPEFTKAVIPRGTTTIIIDPHEIANVMGLEGINYMLKSSKYNPMSVYIMLPSCVPATHFETAGAELKAIDLLPLLANKWVLGLGEMMNYPGLLQNDEDVIEKIRIAQEKIIDGHAPGLTGKDLCAYLAAGIRSDHECTSVEEAREKLRLGMMVMIREASSAHNLDELLSLITPENKDRFFFVSDDRNPNDLLELGHIDFMIRRAINFGIDPITAIRLATINTAHYFQLAQTGAIAPGFQADIVILDDLEKVSVHAVLKNGEIAFQNNELTYKTPDHTPVRLRGSVNIKWLSTGDFDIPAEPGDCRVIQLIPGQIITRQLCMRPQIEENCVVADSDRDLLKLAVIERHSASEEIGRGLIRGFGLRHGALATTVSHDSHNMVVIGSNNQDMYTAAVHLARVQGGIVVAANGKVLACLPLPIAGLMSDQPLEVVRQALQQVTECARELGCTLPNPFMTLSFIALPVIPSLKLTDRGLFDVDHFCFVPLFLNRT